MSEKLKTLYVFISAVSAIIPTTLAAWIANKLHWPGVVPAVVFVLTFAFMLMILCITYVGSSGRYDEQKD